MKIVAVLGSPRLNGNSAIITERFLEAAEKAGAETRKFALNKMAYKGCQACMACKRASDVCIVKDELTEVLQAVREADVLVMASPVYYGDVTGQLKLFIDRTYCFLTPDYRTNDNRTRLAPGKKLVFVQTQGLADEAGFADIFPRYEQMFTFIGYSEAHLLRACGLSQPGEVREREDVLNAADALAAKLVG